jgi:hypothetical protein
MIQHSIRKCYLPYPISRQAGLIFLWRYAHTHPHSRAWIPALRRLMAKGGVS